MPFPMKIQPLDSGAFQESIRSDSVKPHPVLKSRLKRLFDRQFHGVLKNSSAEKAPAGGEQPCSKDVSAEFEPSSVCLDNMVQNFIEDTNEKQSTAKLSRNRCNCFNGNNNESSDDESDDLCDSVPIAPSNDSSDTLKSLIPCASKTERNLLADTSKIVEKHKTCKRKDDLRTLVAAGLVLLGYDASVCKSRWEKSSSCPAGNYEYIDVIVEGGERVLVDVDFRSEFEIARSTGSYKALLQSLPHIFVGEPDRLSQIVSIISEAAKQSLKKKGMHIPPWRKAEYMRAKWLSPHTRTAVRDAAGVELSNPDLDNGADSDETSHSESEGESEGGELELIFGEETASSPKEEIPGGTGKPKVPSAVVSTWQPPVIKAKSCETGAKVVVTGLASLLREKP